MRTRRCFTQEEDARLIELRMQFPGSRIGTKGVLNGLGAIAKLMNRERRVLHRRLIWMAERDDQA